MKIESAALDSIKRYGRNPRTNEAAVGPVAESIQRFGFRQPIVIDKKRVIVCGDTRYLAAQQLGLARVPVHVAVDLTPAQIRAYRIADNKLHELAEWNVDLLRVELASLGGGELDLSLLGFDERELAGLLEGLREGKTDPDDVPAPPDKPVTRRGDLWILGNHRLLCGDGGEPADVDRLIDGATIDLVNTDPPYNVNVEPRSNNAIAAGLTSFTITTSGMRTRAQKTGHAGNPTASPPGKPTGKLRAKDRPLENDFLSSAEFDDRLRRWFGNLARVLKPGGSFYIWGGYANCVNYPPALAAMSLYFAQAIIWIKEHPVLTRKDFMGNHEWCFYGWKEGAAHAFFGAHNLVDTWELSRAKSGGVAIGRGVEIITNDGSRLGIVPPRDDARLRPVSFTGDSIVLHGATECTDVWRVRKVPPQRMVHLTEKPVELATRAILYSSRKGENVLDLFGGSGSTLIAAEQAERRAFLMETDPLYCDVIVNRWEKFSGEKARREKPGHAERPSRRLVR